VREYSVCYAGVFDAVYVCGGRGRRSKRDPARMRAGVIVFGSVLQMEAEQCVCVRAWGLGRIMVPSRECRGGDSLAAATLCASGGLLGALIVGGRWRETLGETCGSILCAMPACSMQCIVAIVVFGSVLQMEVF